MGRQLVDIGTKKVDHGIVGNIEKENITENIK
jgi:hypothetical protein